eukprot:TRINITY_DN135666_c0_g1_i1.p1 TRINITY_DN135666_c0_g1~~TRINITY_DN135666_c0_g1_i1.p1  ORF type:complete len:276 (+),score=32.22 TRINITY_DN135666_c0_g1_i1:1735-2562(+)
MVNAKLCKGKTNPVARASFTGNLDMVTLLVEKGANIEIPTENGNTALMWAAYVGNTHIVRYLLSKNAIVNHYNREGCNALDLAVSRMQYSAALLLYEHGAKLRPVEEYRTIVRAIFDLDKFMQCLLEKKEVPDVSIFYIRKSKFRRWFFIIDVGVDMVVDTRENWKQFFSRVWNFQPAPMIERAELPPEKQPHRSIYGKLSCYMRGINPYPPPRAPAEVQVEVKGEKENTCTYQEVDISKQEEKKEEKDEIGTKQVEVTIKKFSFDDKQHSTSVY